MEKIEKEMVPVKLGEKAKGGFWNSGSGYFIQEEEVVEMDINDDKCILDILPSPISPTFNIFFLLKL